MIDKILNKRSAVEELLTHYPELRDSEKRVVVNIWAKEIEKMGLPIEPYTPFFKLFLEGKISNHDSITRCWRKVQEDNPQLRGVTWVDRQKNSNIAKIEFAKDRYER